MDPARARALRATLGIRGHDPVLQPFFHQVYFWDARPPEDLGRDGHPRVGGFIPDLGLPRRMWAGGRLKFLAPLRTGAEAEKTTTIESIDRKTGRSGPLAFVTLRHDIAQGGRLCVTEHQDIVYRQDPTPGAAPPTAPDAPTQAHSTHQMRYDPTLLFRYSALTFNGHRIHYDRDYCRTVEGYDGLVVHGPLLAQQLMLLAESEIGPLAEFRFRATSALIDTETAWLCRRANALWVRGPDGRMCMQAEAVPA